MQNGIPLDSFSSADLEKNDSNRFLMNDIVQDFSWSGLTVTVKDRQTKQARDLINNVSGSIQQGELVALMGPSGCGKTTLLNVLSHRAATSGAKVMGDTYVNGSKISSESFERMTSYVEQEDALIGSLTVSETLKFAADLALPSDVTKQQRMDRIRTLLEAFGIQSQASTLVGTPIRKGISGGQKRRVSVASQLITCPKILFLDEPTSGLDSKASFEVMNYAKKLAKDNNIIIIASIHQPSSTTFQLFDKLLLLSAGRTCYNGAVSSVEGYLERIGYPIPGHTNPAEFLLDVASADFGGTKDPSHDPVKEFQNAWAQSPEAAELDRAISQRIDSQRESKGVSADLLKRPQFLQIVLALLHRLFIKSYRDVVAYGIRIAMYLGTVQQSIQPFINSIFFGSAFMSFMAVAYVPAFLEDHATFSKERANGLYGALPFMIANFLIGLPYLFLIAVLFSVVAYWLTNFQPTAVAFWTWIMWVFLDLVAAESLVVFVTSIFPNFVISLAIVAFANGLWMCVGGFLVSIRILNPFWKYVFHYIDYQAYVFQGMMVNEFKDRTYACGPSCHCMYQSDLADQCRIRGTAVLEQYGYATGRTGKWAGILVGIIAVYRLFGWIALYLRR
ncbi:transporter [Aspergillus sp. HF37]|nr:transporter [Aspergillus sp. HF37]